MPQIINTNISSLTAQRNLNTSQNDLNTSLQRLSSGLRINSAKDDAAGLAISERFTTQIRGLNQAQRNANDGISLAQTAEGDLAQITNNLQRIRELAVQSANATNSASDRAALQLETAELIAEIDRVAQNSSFNGVRLLDGGFATQQFQVGANADQTVAIDSIASARTLSLGQTFSASLANTANVTSTFADGDLTVNGFAITANADAAEIAADITAADASLTATATNVTTGIVFADVAATAASTGALGAITEGVDADNVNQFDIVLDDGAGNVFTSTTSNLTLGAGLEAALTTSLTTAFGADGQTANNGYTIDIGANATVAAAIAADQLIFQRADGADFTLTETATGFSTSDPTFAGTTAGTLTTTNGVPIDYSLTLEGTSLDLSAYAATGTITSANIKTAIDAAVTAGTLTGYTVVDNTGSLDITTADGKNITFTESGTTSGAASGLVADGSAATATEAYRGVVASIASTDGDIVIGGNTPSNAGLTAGTTTASTTLSGTTIAATDISTVAGANAAIVSVDSALTTINTSRAALGAIQNRFESVVASIQTTSENLSAARSRIRDADFAEETAALTRAQILQQAGVSILAQANSLPQNVLALLQ